MTKFIRSGDFSSAGAARAIPTSATIPVKEILYSAYYNNVDYDGAVRTMFGVAPTLAIVEGDFIWINLSAHIWSAISYPHYAGYTFSVPGRSSDFTEYVYYVNQTVDGYQSQFQVGPMWGFPAEGAYLGSPSFEIELTASTIPSETYFVSAELTVFVYSANMWEEI